MGLLDDFADEIDTYPRTYLDVQIVQVDPSGSNTDINEDEEVSFRIQVSNSGPLDANQVSLLVEGLNGTEVQSNGTNSPWVDKFTISGAFFGNVLGHSSDEGPKVTPGEKFHFRNSRDFPTSTALVRASVAGWQTSFDHFSAGHTTDDDSLAQDIYGSVILE